jgi:hypothetical protein
LNADGRDDRVFNRIRSPERGPMSGIHVLRDDFEDGTSILPVKIERGAPNWEADLDEAESCFRDLHRGKGTSRSNTRATSPTSPDPTRRR